MYFVDYWEFEKEDTKVFDNEAGAWLFYDEINEEQPFCGAWEPVYYNDEEDDCRKAMLENMAE